MCTRRAACLSVVLTLLLAGATAFAQAAVATTAPPVAAPAGDTNAVVQSAPPPIAPAADTDAVVQPAPMPTETPGGVPPEAPAVAPKITMMFKDQPLDTILTDLSERLGLAIVKASDLKEVRVSIIARQPLGVDDIISVLNSALNIKGYAAVRSGATGRVLKIVTLDEAKKQAIPVHQGTRPDLIPTTDEVITQVMALRYVDAVRLRQDLTPLISPSANITSNAAGNALIVTDTSANVHRIAEIVWSLDNQTVTAAQMKNYTLKFADASSVAKLINDLFKQTQQASAQAAGAARFAARAAIVTAGRGPGGPGGNNAAASQQPAYQPPPVTATADVRTNTMVVTGPQESLAIVDEVVKTLETNTTEDQAVFLYPLRNGTAANIATVLNNIFGTGTATGAGGRGGGQRTAPAGLGSTAAASAGVGLYGQVYVVANADTNSILYMTAPKNKPQVDKIITGLDRPIPQVLIRVLIAEVTHDDSVDLGAEFSVLNLTSAAPGSRGGQLFTNIADLPQPAAGGLVYKALEKDFSATLRALETIGKLDVLSRPYILASDNQKATFQDVVQYPFANGTRVDVNGNVNTSITWQTLGISLAVTPKINPEGVVTMTITPEIDTLTGQVVQITGPSVTTSGVTVPGLSEQVWGKRVVTSIVAVRNGQTIVIGGMIQDKKTDTINKVPILGDIPLIGVLFRHTITNKAKTEVLIFLTPMVAMNQQELEALSKVEQQGAGHELRDAVEPGTFQKHVDAMQQQVPGAVQQQLAPSTNLTSLPQTPPEAVPPQLPAPDAAPSQTPPAAAPSPAPNP